MAILSLQFAWQSSCKGVSTSHSAWSWWTRGTLSKAGPRLKSEQRWSWCLVPYPRYNKADPCYLLTRREQVTVFRLRTSHNRLNYHLYCKLRIGYTEECLCGTSSQTTEHLLQFCPLYEPLRKGIWPDHTPVAHKLYGSLRDLRCTANLTEKTGHSI